MLLEAKEPKYVIYVNKSSYKKFPQSRSRLAKSCIDVEKRRIYPGKQMLQWIDLQLLRLLLMSQFIYLNPEGDKIISKTFVELYLIYLTGSCTIFDWIFVSKMV